MYNSLLYPDNIGNSTDLVRLSQDVLGTGGDRRFGRLRRKVCLICPQKNVMHLPTHVIGKLPLPERLCYDTARCFTTM
ncbi:MAG: hypothetical protein WA705_04840 [Candidatus Ozemobacteraceae bacterium]